MLIGPNNILSIDHLQPITIENKEYKSISHYIYSKVICDRNRTIILNARADQLRPQFQIAFLDCYRDYMWKNIQRVLDIQFSIPHFANMLLQTGNDKILYLGYAKDQILGVNEQLVGENKIGKYMVEIREKYLKSAKERQAEKQSAETINRVFVIHMEYEMLFQYAENKQVEITEKNFDKALINGYSKLLTLYDIPSLVTKYMSEKQTLKGFIPNVLQPLLIQTYEESYKNSIYDLYKRGQLTQAEYNQDRIGYRTEVYFDLLNSSASEPIQKDSIKEQKYAVLTLYLHDFFSRNYPNSDGNTMTLDFMANTEDHKIHSLADRLWSQIDNQELPEYLFNILSEKKAELKTIKKKQLTFGVNEIKEIPRREEQESGPVEDPFHPRGKLGYLVDNKYDQQSSRFEPIDENLKEGPIDRSEISSQKGIVVIRETFDPLDKLNSKLSLTCPNPYLIGGLGYPTLLHYVFARTATIGSFDIDKDIRQARKQLLINKSVMDGSTNIRDFDNFDSAGDKSFKFAQKIKNIHMYKYLQQAIYEKVLRNPEFAYALKTSTGSLYYYDPSNLFLGINDKKDGTNMVGHLLFKIRKDLRNHKYTTLNIPILFLLSDNTVKNFVFEKIKFITEVISIFGEYINIPRQGFVAPLGIITEDSVKYITRKVTNKCLFTNTSYAIPEMIKDKINEIMGQQTKMNYSKFLPLYVWNYIYQLMIVYYFYIYKTMDASEKTRLLNEIDEFASDPALQNINTLSMSLVNVQKLLENYVHDVQDGLEYSVQILLGKTLFDEYVQSHSVKNINELLSFVNDKKLWKRIVFFQTM